MVFWRRRARKFEVLGEQFVLPTLDLKPRLDRAARMRQRLGASWLERLTDPIFDPFRKSHRKIRLGFLRAHRVLSAHEAIVYSSLDHVAIYDDALVRATQHVVERSRQKVDDLLAKAAERKKLADRAAHLAARIGPQLDKDLGIFADRIRAIGKAAHLILVRLQRYRSFVKRTLASLVHRENQLAAQRTLLIHDEHTFEIGRELAEDRDFGRWMIEPDALCAGIEASLRDLVTDLDGLEGGLSAVPDAVERLLEKAEIAEPDVLADPLLGFDAATGPLAATNTALSLPALRDVPERLDDTDWDNLAAHEFEAAIVFRATSVEALGIEVADWLSQQGGTGKSRARQCATCSNTIMGGATLGRAHVLCVPCRELANSGGHEWLRKVGFDPARPDRNSPRFETDLVTRIIFESVLGWVPSAGSGPDPVTDVSWYEAIEFCNALSRREGRRPAYRLSGDTVRLRHGPAIDGWRLPDATSSSRGEVREWLWASAESAGSASTPPIPRRLSGGLRLIASPHAKTGFDRCVPDAREVDVSFRIVCDGLPHRRQAQVRPTLQRRSKQRSPSPTPPRPTSPVAVRRIIQALSLSMLVTGAAAVVFIEQVGVTQVRSSSPIASTSGPMSSSTPIEPRTAPPPETIFAPVDNPVPELEAAPARTNPADLHLEQGYTARAKKDRKAARAFFDRAVVVAPDDLTARYEAAREAAHARDTNQAFLHLNVIKAAATEHGKARQILLQALSEPDFARLKRAPRWKALEEFLTR